MTITRVEVDGVEFFTINATGKSGTSISGAARLNGVTQQSMSELIQNVGTGKVQSECLKPFLGKDMRVQVTFDRKEAHTQITWLQSEFVAAVTEYYAFESRHKTPEAVFSFRKFAAMGIERWIHSITGWEAPKPKHHEPLTHAEKLGIDPRYKAVTLDRHVIYTIGWAVRWKSKQSMDQSTYLPPSRSLRSSASKIGKPVLDKCWPSAGLSTAQQATASVWQ